MNLIPLILIISASLLFPGIIGIIKSKVTGRKAPSVFQPLRDTIRLFKKGAVYSSTISFIFKTAPLVYLSSIVTAMFLVPACGFEGVLSFKGDLILFAYLLASGKFMMIISAMDAGSGFEGMGANREALYSMLVEPAFFVLMGSLALFTDNYSFYQLFQHLYINSDLSYIIAFASVYVFIYIAMVENSRMPVDDPKTHLELTMVHEVMVLDNSGFDLGLINIASWLKFSIYGTFISNLIINSGWSLYLQFGTFILIQALFPVIVGLLESFKARNKMEKNPQWLLMLSAIAIVAFLTTLIISNKIILD